MVDYTSLLSLEDRRRRFSEVLDDKNLRDTIRMEKMFRQLQRQGYCREQHVVRCTTATALSNFIIAMLSPSFSSVGLSLLPSSVPASALLD